MRVKFSRNTYSSFGTSIVKNKNDSTLLKSDNVHKTQKYTLLDLTSDNTILCLIHVLNNFGIKIKNLVVSLNTTKHLFDKNGETITFNFNVQYLYKSSKKSLLIFFLQIILPISFMKLQLNKQIEQFSYTYT